MQQPALLRAGDAAIDTFIRHFFVCSPGRESEIFRSLFLLRTKVQLPRCLGTSATAWVFGCRVEAPDARQPVANVLSLPDILGQIAEHQHNK